MLALTVVACTPSAQPGAQEGPASATSASQPQPTVVLASRGEPVSLAVLAFANTSGNFRMARVFNAGLDFKDEHDQPQPYLAQSLPQLNTDDWVVNADGTMTTTWHLKPNLTWQDGAPLTANDFVFAYEAYSDPALGQSGSSPVAEIASVEAPDPSTVVINWKQLYADAVVENGGLYPLPQHLLEQPLQTEDPASFISNAFWTQSYVGAGPYAETEYVPGDHLDAVAFDNHALGRPKIDKIRIVFIGDPEAGVAQLLAGTLDYADEFVVSPADAVNLEQQWASSQAGEVLWSPDDLRMALVQWRPEDAQPPGIQDPRVRQALAYGFDTQGALDSLNYGKGVLTSTITPPGITGYSAIDQVISKYAYDPHHVAELMQDAGYSIGSDGFFADSSGTRFEIDVWCSAGEKNVEEAEYFVDGLKKVGIDADLQVYSLQQFSDFQARDITPGLSIRGGASYESFLTSEVAGPANNWAGGNRSGYTNPDYDRFYDQYESTLDQTQRIDSLANLERVFTQDVGAILMYFQDTPTVRVAQLQGPENVDHQGAGGGVLRIQDWTWQG